MQEAGSSDAEQTLFNELISTYKVGLKSADFDSMVQGIISKLSEKTYAIEEQARIFLAGVAEERRTCVPRALRGIAKLDKVTKAVEAARDESHHRIAFFVDQWKKMFETINGAAPKEIVKGLVSAGANLNAKRMSALVYDGARRIFAAANNVFSDLTSAQTICYRAMFGNYDSKGSEEN